MVEDLLDNSKLVKIPKTLSNKVHIVSGRLSKNISEYTTDALTQALRIYEMGGDLEEAVSSYQMNLIHKGAGFVNLPRSSLETLVSIIQKGKLDIISEGVKEAGMWYAAYVSSKLPTENILGFLESDLKITWNLDEVEIEENDVIVHFRAISFSMNNEVTKLLDLYTRGIFHELGYSIKEENILPGLLSFRLIKTMV